MVYQLQVDEIDPNQSSVSGLEQLDEIDFMIPFLSPANQAWPRNLEIPGANFGFLERTRNAAQVDLRASCGLVGESKDYGSEIKIEI